MTAARDALKQENEKLKAELKGRKTKHPGKKAANKNTVRAEGHDGLETRE
jgi:hypothetical protein